MCSLLHLYSQSILCSFTKNYRDTRDLSCPVLFLADMIPHNPTYHFSQRGFEGTIKLGFMEYITDKKRKKSKLVPRVHKRPINIPVTWKRKEIPNSDKRPRHVIFSFFFPFFFLESFLRCGRTGMLFWGVVNPLLPAAGYVDPKIPVPTWCVYDTLFCKREKDENKKKTHLLNIRCIILKRGYHV
jgi:hypothetical protein